MKLKDKEGVFVLKMKLGSDVFIHCQYKKGARVNNGYNCQLMEVALEIGLMVVTRHKCGGADLWMNENIEVQ